MSLYKGQIIGKTRSICPQCGKQIEAKQVKRADGIYMVKSCGEHGDFDTVIWRGPISFDEWRGKTEPLHDDENMSCPNNCGICEEHKQATCCVLYELTSRCNLRCSFCFADGGKGQDIPLKQVKKDIEAIIVPGKTFLQLSGGEPTMRDDLPEIVAYAKEKGAKYVQLNSNGLRLAEDEQYVKRLAEAGLSFVFMQFDGTNDDIYIKLRGLPLFTEKKQAIANCAKHHIGVTLVPTLVPRVNTDDIGNIIRFCIDNVPATRGVHFQPVSYFGRYPAPPKDADRYTLGDLLGDIEEQTAGLIKTANIAPSHCDHALCGFHGSFIAMEDGTIDALTTRESEGCCCGSVSAEQNREYVGSRWLRRDKDIAQTGAAGCGAEEEDDFDRFIRLSKTRSFTVTAMAFQDAYNLDIERLRQCSLHVYNQGKTVPFCANYLSLMEQKA